MEDYEFGDDKMLSVAEPSCEFGTKVRKMSREELDRDYITLDELDRRLSETIRRHFHPEA